MLLKTKSSGVRLVRYLSYASGLSWASLLFLLLVFFPTVTASFYYLFIASDEYIVETDFIVRSIKGSQSGGISSLLETFGISRAEDQSYAVIDFILSRDAVQAIDKTHPLRQIFSRAEADYFARYPHWWAFWRPADFESLYDYYYEMVDARYSSNGGIIKLKIIAFTPEDAKTLAEQLLHQSELLINRMNERAAFDGVSFAKKELDRAEAMVVEAQQKITDFRYKQLILDPLSDAAKALDLIASLSGELANTKSLLNETLQSSPSNPAVQSLRGRINALIDQIAAEKRKIVGQDDSLAPKLAVYERLALDRQFADQNLSVAFSNLQTALQTAWQQQLYIENIVSPNLPDASTEPQSTRDIAAVFVITFFVYALIWLAVSASKEHAN